MSTTTVLIKDLSPKIAPSLSPNLYRWLRAKGTGRHQGVVLDSVFKVKPSSPLSQSIGAGTLVIGHPCSAYQGDTDISGIRLIEVLVSGTQAGRVCLAGAASSLELVADFWPHYSQVGRCAFDPLHMEHFKGTEHYTEVNGVKTCLWCGAVCQHEPQ